MTLDSSQRIYHVPHSLCPSCLNNCKQMGLGSQSYGDDDANHALTGVCNFGDDDLNWPYPTYVPNLKTFICASTHHSITNDPKPVTSYVQTKRNDTGVTYAQRLHENATYIPDLTEIAEDGAAYDAGNKAGHGTSYEVSGWLAGARNSPASQRWSSGRGAPSTDREG